MDNTDVCGGVGLLASNIKNNRMNIDMQFIHPGEVYKARIMPIN